MQNVIMKGEKMYRLKKYITTIIVIIILLLCNCVTINASNIVNNTKDDKIQYTNNTINESTKAEESTATILLNIKDEQLKSVDDYKAKYGSDVYGMVAYILHLVQQYSIPLGIVGIAFCAIYEYVIGVKRLDIRDKGFNTMIAVITIIMICQILPLIFTVVVKSKD